MVSALAMMIFTETHCQVINYITYDATGTPYVYQGDELGMVNNQVTHIEEFDDEKYEAPIKIGKIKGKILINLSPFQMKKVEIMHEHPCNGCLSNGGFSTVKPWLASNQKYKLINVALQEKTNLYSQSLP